MHSWNANCHSHKLSSVKETIWKTFYCSEDKVLLFGFGFFDSYENSVVMQMPCIHSPSGSNILTVSGLCWRWFVCCGYISPNIKKIYWATGTCAITNKIGFVRETLIYLTQVYMRTALNFWEAHFLNVKFDVWVMTRKELWKVSLFHSFMLIFSAPILAIVFLICAILVPLFYLQHFLSLIPISQE